MTKRQKQPQQHSEPEENSDGDDLEEKKLSAEDAKFAVMQQLVLDKWATFESCSLWDLAVTMKTDSVDLSTVMKSVTGGECKMICLGMHHLADGKTTESLMNGLAHMLGYHRLPLASLICMVSDNEASQLCLARSLKMKKVFDFSHVVHNLGKRCVSAVFEERTEGSLNSLALLARFVRFRHFLLSSMFAKTLRSQPDDDKEQQQNVEAKQEVKDDNDARILPYQGVMTGRRQVFINRRVKHVMQAKLPPPERHRFLNALKIASLLHAKRPYMNQLDDKLMEHESASRDYTKYPWGKIRQTLLLDSKWLPFAFLSDVYILLNELLSCMRMNHGYMALCVLDVLDDFLVKLNNLKMEELRCCDDVLSNPLNPGFRVHKERETRKVEEWLFDIKQLIRDQLSEYRDNLVEQFPLMLYFSRKGRVAILNDLIAWKQHSIQPTEEVIILN